MNQMRLSLHPLSHQYLVYKHSHSSLMYQMLNNELLSVWIIWKNHTLYRHRLLKLLFIRDTLQVNIYLSHIRHHLQYQFCRTDRLISHCSINSNHYSSAYRRRQFVTPRQLHFSPFLFTIHLSWDNEPVNMEIGLFDIKFATFQFHSVHLVSLLSLPCDCHFTDPHWFNSSMTMVRTWWGAKTSLTRDTVERRVICITVSYMAQTIFCCYY